MGIGIAMLSLETAFANPFQAIAAGTALIALAGAAKGLLSSVGKGSSRASSAGETSLSNLGRTDFGNAGKRSESIFVSGSFEYAGSTAQASITSAKRKQNRLGF